MNNNIARLLPSSDTFTISKILVNKPTLIIANDAYNTNRIFDELCLFSNDKKIVIFPDLGVLPYERLTPQKDIIAKQLKTLWQINLAQIDVLIVQASTLQECLCPTKYLLQKILIFKVGERLSLTNLKTQLIESNYINVDKVFEVGEFAVHGGIIDVIPMGYKKLIRIELFDDEIESLKLLDIKTHQLIKSIDLIELIPGSSYPTDNIDFFVAKFNSRFRSLANSLLVKEINSKILPAGSEFYLPLFFNKVSSLFDYLSNSWQIVYFDNVFNELERSYREIEQRYKTFNSNYPCLRPDELFFSIQEITSNISKFKNYQMLTSGELNKDIKPVPGISADKNQNFNKLLAFRKSFSGKVIFAIDSLGRLEILRQNLANNNFMTKVITKISQADSKDIYLINAKVYNSFISHDLCFIVEDDLYKNHKQLVRHKKITNITNNIIDDIKYGDYIVHTDYGIGKYLGLTTQNILDVDYEMLELEYAKGSKLFIPVTNLHLINRYSKVDSDNIELSSLGSKNWQKIKTKANKKVEDTAAGLLELYAKREIQQRDAFIIPPEYEDFIHSFGYEPTFDQVSSFEAIIKDMTDSKPMDRLVCGDVGFGKTEVAIRAAFIAAMNGRQVAILTPTTLLTEQHFQNFSNRFAAFPIRVAEVSRFKSKKEITNTLEQVKNGTIDILIGTHRLLQKDIKFANLGLVVIDEEHRFGVKQKERLKELRTNVDFLTLTATPIPRTLSMALEGLKEFSIIATPPQKRLAIKNIVCNEDRDLIREASLREARRGGQIFFLYNDVATIDKMYDKLSQIIPEIKIAVAHGQMHENVLEKTIYDFIKQKYNLLLCSTIIENGIDIGNANTIFIYRADKLGLAQLHQIRGRVGRSHHQAYCYLIIPENITSDAQKRIDALKTVTELGSGLNLAMHDLEIRGAGEILGSNQAGEIKEVGLSLYTEMLKKAIKRLKQDFVTIEQKCEINLNTTCILPHEYCPDVHTRLLFYKHLNNAQTIDEVDLVYQEIIDKLGLPLEPVKNLIQANYIRVKANTIGINRLDANNKYISLIFSDNPNIEISKLAQVMQELKTCRYDEKQNKLIWNIEIDNNIKNANILLDKLIINI